MKFNASWLVKQPGPYNRLGRPINSSDIGIPNGPAEDSTRGLLKANYPQNKKTRKPKDIIKES